MEILVKPNGGNRPQVAFGHASLHLVPDSEAELQILVKATVKTAVLQERAASDALVAVSKLSLLVRCRCCKKFATLSFLLHYY